MLSHIHIGVSNFAQALAFYDTVLATIGWRRRFVDLSRPWAGWRPLAAERPLVLVGTPIDGQAAAAGNGQMFAFLAPSQAAVADFHAAALAQGGVCEGPPGPRPEYHPNYFGAYVRDPDGNKLCACCHDGV